MNKQRRIPKSWIIICVIAIFLSFFRLPFYISTPGMAKELAPIVKVDGGYSAEGSFSLTTIRMGKANIVQYAWAKVNDYHEIYREEQIRPDGETNEEYNHRQLYMMEDSKEQATVVAYTEAKKDIDISYNGVYVSSIIKGMPAEKQLEIGDRLFAVDGKEMRTAKEFISNVTNKKAGDVVKLKLERDGKKIEKNVHIGTFPDSEVPESERGKVGLGIVLVEDRSVKVNPNVEIDTSQIGGPSAGLMFTLEIYNQLVEEDLTKGYKIAGTGTIDYDGNVGRIGGIKQKIVAAHKSGVEIFFAPNEHGKEHVSVNGDPIPTNYQEALEAARDIKTEMKIIPVDTFKDALNYLEKLEPTY
ncbi:SepM family pheromone-processing serine protease [Calidifontibacillus oryziterrae]|uniref:SepM family pheromone-processing serine protease n=1 Tax=Calidifontibacillus oryziterrae TaxID=1191699 RepID=UPI0002DBAB7E|nr:SepM family pheromone-processing serine protease [Calidifontibacillus oryziterrae]